MIYFMSALGGLSGGAIVGGLWILIEHRRNLRARAERGTGWPILAPDDTIVHEVVGHGIPATEGEAKEYPKAKRESAHY